MHDFQPKHSKLSKEEKLKLLAKLNVSFSQFPKISIDDPALIGGSYAIGDLVHIERKDENKEIIEYFRVVAK